MDLNPDFFKAPKSHYTDPEEAKRDCEALNACTPDTIRFEIEKMVLPKRVFGGTEASRTGWYVVQYRREWVRHDY